MAGGTAVAAFGLFLVGFGTLLRYVVGANTAGAESAYAQTSAWMGRKVLQPLGAVALLVGVVIILAAS